MLEKASQSNKNNLRESCVIANPSLTHSVSDCWAIRARFTVTQEAKHATFFNRTYIKVKGHTRCKEVKKKGEPFRE